MVVQRELRALSRRNFTYWTRFAAAGIAVFVMAQFSLAANSGAKLFEGMLTVGFLLCAIDGLRRAAVSITEERIDGTLGLLLLTPLSGKEVLFGKYWTVMIASLPMALAVAPIFAVVFLLGGVSGSEFVRAGLGLVHMQSIVVGIGILTSSNARTAGPALVASVFALGFATIVAAIFTPVKVFSPINPLTPIVAIAESKIAWSAIITSICLWQFFIYAILTQKGRAFAKQWRDSDEEEIRFGDQRPYTVEYVTPAPPPVIAPSNAKPAYDATGTPRWFGENPMEWLTLRDAGMHSGPWVLGVAGGLCALFSLLTPVGIFYTGLFMFGLVIFLCIASARPFAISRQSGALELIVTTPIGYRGMIAGHLHALRRIFMWPSIIGVGTFSVFILRNTPGNPEFLLGFYFLAGLAALLYVTPWIGMWMGLNCKTPMRAACATIVLVMVAPRAFFCVFGDVPYFLAMFFVARKFVVGNFERQFR